jgi:chitosanase
MYYIQERFSGMKQEDLLKALAIVNIFETGKPFGEFGAVAVLNDGAGISYGISQFTHRSGSLAAVVERYLELGGVVGRYVLENALPNLRRKEPVVIRAYAKDERFKKVLRSAAVTREMRVAQLQIAFEKYLQPSIEEVQRLGFVLPLSLAVVFDSITHGSYERFRDRIKTNLAEKEWITEYVRIRDRWLASVPRLNTTRYRTRFFLNQIMLGQWELRLPLNVNGFWLRDGHIAELFKFADVGIGDDLAVGPNFEPHRQSNINTEIPPTSSQILTTTPQAQPPTLATDTLEQRVIDAVSRFDHADRLITAVVGRTDRAKSLWTTVVGTIWQTAWAIFSFLIGLPRVVWLAVAIIVAALMLFYLYRQIALGKLRELK